ncbi:hypothetical protein PS15m_005801 [Mucor circinelloides]
MALIFINDLTSIVSDSGQYRCVINGSLVVYETHMYEPQLREGNDEDPVWLDSVDLAIPNIGKIQGQKSLLEILDRCSRPEKLENYTLPNFQLVAKRERERERETNTQEIMALDNILLLKAGQTCDDLKQFCTEQDFDDMLTLFCDRF